MAEALLTLDMVAERLNRHRKTLLRLLPELMGHNPALRARRVGRSLMFTEDDYQELLKTLNPPPPLPQTKLGAVWHQVFAQAERGAKRRKIDWLLSVPECQAIIDRANGKCEVSGLFFAYEKEMLRQWRPYHPSLDRIDSKRPCVAENCRLVCCAVNVALGAWGEETLLRISRAIVEKADAD